MQRTQPEPQQSRGSGGSGRGGSGITTTAIYAARVDSRRTSAEHAGMTPSIAALHLYPLKSGAALSPASAEVEAHGLAGDRRWMIVDEQARFVTGRSLPRMVLLRATPLGSGLRLEYPGAPALELAFPEPGHARLAVRVWNDAVEAQVAEPAGDWLARRFECPLRLVYMDERALRPVRPDYGNPGDVVSFADGFPLLLIGSGSLDALNARLGRAVPMARFRPNVVVQGSDAHAEDDWRRVRIGAVTFDVVKPCTRCVFTTVDPETGTLDPDGEPLATLRQYRRTPAGVTFGQNLIPRGTGTIHVGDPVEQLL